MSLDDNSHQSPELNAAAIEQLFAELSDELERRGQRAQLFVVGGAAMALAYDATRSTKDIDAAFEPSTAVRESAALIAVERGLPADWLNDAAKGFFPGADPDPRTVFESEWLLVQVASPKYLLAMKLHSGRLENDRSDAVILYRLAGFTTAEQGMELLESTYGAHHLSPRHRYIVEEVAGAANAERAAQLAATAAGLRARQDHIDDRPPPHPEPPRRGMSL